MRITQQNIAQNNINSVKSQLTPSEAKALIGTALEGKITSIQGNQLAILTTGDKQLNVNINGLNLQENQLVNLKIIGFKDGALIAKLVGGSMPSESTNSLSEILTKLGLSDQAENVTILEAMKTANIPITKDNFQMMRQGMNEVKALVSELAIAGQLTLENDLETPIKALALKIIQQNVGVSDGVTPVSSSGTIAKTGSTNNLTLEGESEIKMTNSPANTAANTPVNTAANTTISRTSNTPSEMTEIHAETVSMKILDVTTNATTATTVASAVDKSSTEPLVENGTTVNSHGYQGTDQVKKMESDLLSKTIQLAFDKEGSTLKQGIQAMLSQFDYKQESLILKNELPITLKNIFLAYDALSDEGGLANRFTEVLKGLESVPFSKEAILNIVTSLTSDVPQPEKLETLIDIIRKEMPDSESKQGLERELTVIKESTSMSKSLNDQMMFMQMPIPINDQIQNVDIYYKKNKKKADPDDLTLLVALKTFNFGEVRCVVHKQAQTFALHFSFVDEASMAYYEANKELLTTALETHKDKQFSLSFAVKANHPEFQMREESKFESFGFDLKV